MRISFKTFTSGEGDCIFLSLIDTQKGNFTLMVDCGNYTIPIKKYVCNTLNKKIDLLVITHIDADHITGCTSLLNDIPDLSIDKIWFNSYQRTLDDEIQMLTSKQQEYFNRLYGMCNVVVDVVNSKINASHALSLSEVILNNPLWKKAWVRNYITNDISYLSLKEGTFGSFTVLTPTRKVLKELDVEFQELFYEIFHEPFNKKMAKRQTIYELLQRIADENDIEEYHEEIGSFELTQSLIEDAQKDKKSTISKSNKSSISFIWEYNGHRILFLGDADPEQVIKTFKQRYETKPVIFDAIKVSHHGSAHNTTYKLMELIDSEDFFFTGGNQSQRPHIDCIARIINRPLPQGMTKRILHFNYQNELTESLENANLKKRLHYQLDTTENYKSYEI